MCPYRTEHNSSKYMKSTIYQFCTVTLSAKYKINHSAKESHTMKQRQLLSQINSTWLVSLQMGPVLQNECTISTHHKSIIMYNSLVCWELPSNIRAAFSFNIQCAICIHVYCCYFKPLDHFLKF